MVAQWRRQYQHQAHHPHRGSHVPNPRRTWLPQHPAPQKTSRGHHSHRRRTDQRRRQAQHLLSHDAQRSSGPLRDDQHHGRRARRPPHSRRQPRRPHQLLHRSKRSRSVRRQDRRSLLRMPRPVAATRAAQSTRSLPHLQGRRLPRPRHHHSHRERAHLFQRRLPRASRKSANPRRSRHQSFSRQGRRQHSREQPAHAGLHLRRRRIHFHSQLDICFSRRSSAHQKAQERHRASRQGRSRLPARRR